MFLCLVVGCFTLYNFWPFTFNNFVLFIHQVYPSPRELSEETIKLVGHRVKGITHGVQIVKRREWFERLGYDHPLYPVIAMCLQDKPENRWEMDKIRKEMGDVSNKPPPKLINLLKENEVYIREDNVLLLTMLIIMDIWKKVYIALWCHYVITCNSLQLFWVIIMKTFHFNK